MVAVCVFVLSIRHQLGLQLYSDGHKAISKSCACGTICLPPTATANVPTALMVAAIPVSKTIGSLDISITMDDG